VDVLSLLKEDHRQVGGMIDAMQKCDPGDQRLVELGRQISQALTVHAEIEEKFFYPELRDRAEEDEERVDVFEAFTEHDVVKHLISLLKSARRNDERFKAELQVLGESVKHHVKEEESRIFSIARELLDESELEELGEKMGAAKKRLMASVAAGRTNGRRKAPAKKTTRETAGKNNSRKTSVAKRR
jgi:hemerythrin superfamily protein